MCGIAVGKKNIGGYLRCRARAGVPAWPAESNFLSYRAALLCDRARPLVGTDQVQMGDYASNLGYRFYPNALCLEVRYSLCRWWMTYSGLRQCFDMRISQSVYLYILLLLPCALRGILADETCVCDSLSTKRIKLFLSALRTFYVNDDSHITHDVEKVI